MATVSFANLDQTLDTGFADQVEFSSLGATNSAIYSFFTTGGDDWDLVGFGITDNGTTPTGGTITSADLDLDNDLFAAPEVHITGLSVAATSLGINSGSAGDQRDAFWAALLGGDDTINLNLGDFSVGFQFSGDGVDASNSGLYLGGDDSFLDGGAAFTSSNSWLFGDFEHINNGSTVVGGDDTFTAAPRYIVGDVYGVDSGSLIGGDDVITPARLANFSSVGIYGDVYYTHGGVFAGDDVIDLRSADLTGFSGTTLLYGDARTVYSDGALVGGNDSIYGNDAINDAIYGDWLSNSGYAEGGKDRLYGFGGDDTIFGNAGRDYLNGGDGNDSLNGGDDGDIIDAGAGDDYIDGGAGKEIVLGGAGNDTVIGGSGRDTIDGGTGNEAIDAGAGHDSVIGGNGKDSIFGGSGNDTIDGGVGNDTLQGGDDNDLLIGGGGYDAILGGNGNDTINGGDLNDILFGNAGNDIFAFEKGGDVDTIRDFVASGVDDSIRLIGFGAAFDTFAEVLAASSDNGVDTTIDLGGGDMIIVQNVTVAQLSSGDFIFG